MSYSFTVEKKDGQLTVTSDGPTYIPDGRWVVNGHLDRSPGVNSLYVSHTDPAGQLLLTVSGGAQAQPEQQAQPGPAAVEAGVA